MLTALLNDAFQRLVTLNKLEQRRNLLAHLRTLDLAPGSRALDFGCGTGLFVPTFRRAGLRYHGYDVDERLLRYARRLYRDSTFLSTSEALDTSAPFELIVANCCFHHISDELLDHELGRMRKMLVDGGTLIVIDLLLQPEGDRSFLRRQYRKLERGAWVRTAEHYTRLVEQHFVVKRRDRERSHVLSVKGNPLYQRLLVLECEK